MMSSSSPSGSGSADENSNDSNSPIKLPFRIRNVEEINCDGISSNDNLSVTTVDKKKRKLPSWLEGSPSQQTTNTEKRSKPNNKENCSTPGNAHDDTLVTTASVSSSNENENQEINSSNISGDSVEKVPQAEQENNISIVKSEPTESCDQLAEPSSTIEIEPAVLPQVQSNHTTAGNGNDSGAKTPPQIKKEIKTKSDNELTDTTSAASRTTVVKQEASSSTDNGRESCRFGIRCYRQNPLHRQQEAHPGDSDYKRPNHPLPPLGTPMCPYGDQCYRRNPDHFKQFSHPPSTDFKQNWKNKQKVLRERKVRKVVEDQSEHSNDSDNSLKDFIVSDEDDDYVPCSNSGDEFDTEETL